MNLRFPFRFIFHPSYFLLCVEREVNIVPAGTDEVFNAGGIGARLFFAPEPGIVLFRSVRFGASVFVFERGRLRGVRRLLVYRPWRHRTAAASNRRDSCRLAFAGARGRGGGN